MASNIGGVMTTKSELENYLKSEFGMSKIEGETFGADFDLGDGRSQGVLAKIVDDQLIVASPFAEKGQVSADDVFEASHLPVLMMGDMYFAARIFPIADLQTEEVDYMISSAALTADGLEEKLGLGDDF